MKSILHKQLFKLKVRKFEEDLKNFTKVMCLQSVPGVQMYPGCRSTAKGRIFVNLSFFFSSLLLQKCKKR